MGSSFEVGEAMCALILSRSGFVVQRTSVWPLTKEEENSEVVKKIIEEFDVKIKESIPQELQGLDEAPYLTSKDEIEEKGDDTQFYLSHDEVNNDN